MSVAVVQSLTGIQELFPYSYGFRVAAENAVGQSTFCNPVYFQTQGTPPSVPRNLRTMGEKQGEGKVYDL